MRKKTTFLFRLLTLASLAALCLPGTVSAQNLTPSVLINQIGVVQPYVDPLKPGVPGLQLDVAFTVLDSAENVLTNEIEAATFKITNPPREYQLGPGKISTAWRIVLVVDASATLAGSTAGGTLKKMKDVLAGLFGGNQQNTTYALLKFDDVPKLVNDFAQSTPEKLQKAVQSITAKQGGKSCVLDAVHEAVTQLQGTSGRKAVLLVTASPDNCSGQTQDTVVRLAQQNGVEIYPVGVTGFGVSRDQLDPLAQQSGGLATAQSLDKLTFGLGNITAIFNNQWNAKVTLFPKSGTQDGSMILQLKDGTNIASGPISFTADKDYPEPPSIKILGVVTPTKTGFTFNLELTSQEKITELQVEVKSELTGITSPLPRIKPNSANPVNATLNLGEAYELKVTALDDRGTPLSSDSAKFTYALPPPPKLTIGAVQTPTPTQPEFSVAVTSQVPPEVIAFRVFLAVENDKNPIPNSIVVVPNGKPLAIPSAPIPDGQYQMVVQALDSAGDQGNVLDEARSDKFIYQQPTWFEKLILFLQTNPVALAGIGGLCCLAGLGLAGLVWMLVPKGDSKVKEVEIYVPEKQRRVVSTPSSGVFERDSSPVEPPPPPPAPRRQAAPPSPPPARRQAAPAQAQPSNLPPASLIPQNPPTAGPRTPIRKVPCTIGRRDGNDVVLKVDSSMGVSGQHCSIIFQAGQYFVLDEGSSYGTTVNGQTIPKGKPAPLVDGAVIGLGPKVTVQFRLG